MADNKAFFFPVILGDVAEAAALVPDKFRERQWTRLNDDAAIEVFASRVAQTIAKRVSPSKSGSNNLANNASTPFVVCPSNHLPSALLITPAEDQTGASTSATRTEWGDGVSAATQGVSTAAAPCIATPSIAVLAFANRSASADDEYFSDGLADELLNVLAKIKGLRVAARTSAFSFKGKQTTVAEIGKILNVATVLEGSVRTSGSRVRISVQLVKVNDGFQLWGETYDRTLKDIFAVQDDIAQAVVTELRGALMGEKSNHADEMQVIAEIADAGRDRSENSEAQRLFLQGRYLLGRKSEAELMRCIDYLKQAVALDPQFALAWAWLAQALCDAGGWGSVPAHEAYPNANAAATRAIALAPDLVQAHMAMASFQIGYQWDWASAEASVQRALQLAPDNADVLTVAARLAFCLNRFDEAEASGLRAIALDPLNAGSYRMLATVLFGAGKFDAAIERQGRSALAAVHEKNGLCLVNESNNAVKPRLCLTVGGTGHREHKLAGADVRAVTATVERTLSQLQAALGAVAKQHHSTFSSDASELRMVSALADGADTMVAKAALAAGWRVDACLPFPREQYANDFSVAAHHNDFVALLDKVTATFELPGNHGAATAAYEAVGRLVLEQCDVLLALWDGDQNRGRGGTSRVVADAVARHIPVIHINTHANLPTELLWTGLSDVEIEQPSVEIVPRAPADTAIAQVVAALTVPPEHKVDMRMLKQFYRERAATSTPALPYPLLLAVTGVRSLSRRDLKPMQAEASRADLRALLSRSVGNESAATSFAGKLTQRYGVADTAASYFAQIFRSGFVGNFTLAAIAVILALSGLPAPALKLPIICGELICVILILINTHAGKRFGWHERWMDNRHLAEQLRALVLTSVLGDLGLRSHTNHSGHDAAAIPGWVVWLARATARETGLPNVSADAAYLTRVRDMALHLITEQMAYQHTNAGRMHKLEHRLHQAGEILFGGTVVACVAWIIAKLSGIPMGVVGRVGMTEIVTFFDGSVARAGRINLRHSGAGRLRRSGVSFTGHSVTFGAIEASDDRRPAGLRAALLAPAQPGRHHADRCVELANDVSSQATGFAGVDVCTQNAGDYMTTCSNATLSVGAVLPRPAVAHANGIAA